MPLGLNKPTETDLCSALQEAHDSALDEGGSPLSAETGKMQPGAQDGAENAVRVPVKVGPRSSPEGSRLADPCHPHPLAAPSPRPLQMPFELTGKLP